MVDGLWQSLVAPILAALMVYPVHRSIQRQLGTRALLLLSPLSEETSKALLGSLLQGSLLGVHVGFGLIEAVLDYWGGKRDRLRNAVLSLGSHTLFALAAWAASGPGRSSLWTSPISWSVGWIGAVGAHFLWNCVVVIVLTRD